MVDRLHAPEAALARISLRHERICDATRLLFGPADRRASVRQMNAGGVWPIQQFARGSTDLRESEWSSNEPVRMAGLSKELVSTAMYSDDVLRFRRVLLDLLT